MTTFLFNELIYPERDIILLSIFMVLAVACIKLKMLHYILLYAAALVDLPYVILAVSFIFEPGEFYGAVPVVLTSMIVLVVLALSVMALVAFRAKHSPIVYHYRLWHYFALGYIIVMGIPFVLLMFGIGMVLDWLWN